MGLMALGLCCYLICNEPYNEFVVTSYLNVVVLNVNSSVLMLGFVTASEMSWHYQNVPILAYALSFADEIKTNL